MQKILSDYWIIWVCLGGILVFFILYKLTIFCIAKFKASKQKKLFTQRVVAVSPQVSELMKELESLFYPDKRTTQQDIDNFFSKNQNIIDDVNGLYNDELRHDDVLIHYGISDFHSAITPSQLNLQLAENNKIYDGIQKLKNMAETALGTYNYYTLPNHYFAFSEEEILLESLKKFYELADVVMAKYSKYVTDPTTLEMLNMKKDIEQIRCKHNKEFVESELAKNKEFFDTALGAYPLDNQQRDSLVKLEDNCLVIASAGSGKTSTILGKAKYLVEKRNVDPSKILLITYTRKAANELVERMKIDGITCCNFHQLAYKIIAEVTGQAPSICAGDLPLNIFMKLVTDNENFLHAVNNYIINLQSLMKLEHEYIDAFTYFEDRKKYGIQALFPDDDGNIVFTKSEEEKRIVSILARHGVPFKYECNYDFNTRTPEHRQYKPDFTICFKDSDGKEKKVYLEHFATDIVGNVPRWFGEGTRGGWKAANQKYHEAIVWKRQTHHAHGTTLLETTSADFIDKSIERKLIQQLSRCGVPMQERTDKELFELMVKRNRKLEKSVFTLILSFVTLMKANEKSIDKMIDELERRTQLVPGNVMTDDVRSKYIIKEIIKPFFDLYAQEMQKNYEIDFTDAIIQATELCREGLWKDYEYILVDEFQDISVDRYKFLQSLRCEKPKTKLFCVGDDWQSIFRFAGSDMSLVYEFEKYFGYTEQCKIETTYRFHQPLIDKSSDFVMKNTAQKKKTIKPPTGDTKKTYLNFVKCDGDDKEGVLKKVQEIVSKIPTDQSILLLGRYNYDAMSVGFNGKIDMKDNRMMVDIGGRKLPFLSVHSAKGLEAEHVILVNCNQGAYGFPSLIEDDPILDFVLSKSETYPFAEERRLFYVAMTRARKQMYILYDQKKPSPFIGEFMLRVEAGSYLCPRCLEGKMIAIKSGVTVKGQEYRSFKCSNNEGGCDYFETKYGDLTPPGILISTEMTAQDVEALRERRRKGRVTLQTSTSVTASKYVR